MPRKKLPKSFGDTYAAVAVDLMARIGDTLAAQSGPPVTNEQVAINDRDRARAWNQRGADEGPDGVAVPRTDEQAHALAQQRYPLHRQQLGDDDQAVLATAEDLTHFLYPARLKLYTQGNVAYADQIKEATRLSKLAAPPAGQTPAAGRPNTGQTPAPADDVSTGSDRSDPYGYG